MTSQLVVRDAPFILDPEHGLMNRDTGEIVNLGDAPDDLLARLDEALREQRDFARAALAAVEDELKDRISTARARTLATGSHIVELERKREWAMPDTWDALQGLVTAGLVSQEDIEDACPEVVSRKPDGRRLNSILTQVVADDPEAAQALAKARTERTYIKLARTAVDAEAVEE